MPEGPPHQVAQVEAKTENAHAAPAAALDDDAKKFDSMNKMLMTLHLWDRPETVFTRKTTIATKSAATIADFSAKISKLQDDFGKAMVKVAQDFIAMPFPEGTSLSAGWATMLKQTLYTGNQFVAQSRTLQTLVRGGALKKIQPTTLQESAKKATTAIAAARKNQEKEAEAVKKCKLALDKFKEQHAKGATDAHWTDALAPALKTKATELISVQRQAEIAKTMVDAVLQQAIQSGLDEFQVHDGERVQAINGFLQAASEAQNKALSQSYKTGLATQRTIRGFQEAEDLKEFCKNNESGNSCPWIETIVTVGDDGKMQFTMQDKVKNPYSRRSLLGAADKAASKGANPDLVWKSEAKPSTSGKDSRPTVNRTVRGKGTPGMSEDTKASGEHEITLSFSANFLPQMDLMSKSDPFVVVYIRDPVYETFNYLAKTETIMDDEDPVWKTKITFDKKSDNDTLKFVVFDEDSPSDDLSKHDFIGEISVHINDFLAQNPLSLPLKDKKGATVIKGKGVNSASILTISAKIKGNAPSSVPASVSSPISTAPTASTTTASTATTPRTTSPSTASPSPKAEQKQPPAPPPVNVVVSRRADSVAGVNDTTKGDYIPEEPLIEGGGDGGLLTPIVIDNGSAYFKAGFSGDRLPSYVVPGVVVHFPPPFSAGQRKQKSFLLGSAAQHIGPGLCEDPKDLDLNDMVFADQPSNWSDVELMWEYLFNRLGVDIQDHPLLLTQPTMAPLALKSKMEEIMYEKFNCPAVYVAQAPLLSAYAYGHSSGLVVDVGHSSAQVIPIVQGYILDAHVRRVRHLGGLKDTNRIVSYFKENTDSEDPIEQTKYTSQSHVSLMAQSIKDRMCHCPSSRGEYEEDMAVIQDVEGFLGGGDPDELEKNTKTKKRPNMLTLQKELMTCGEVLFQPKEILKDNDGSIVSLQELCRDVAMACDVDTRKTLLSNIFLSGQVTTMPGFAERLTHEVKGIMPHAPYVRVYGEERRFATWTGGSVLSALDAFQDSWKFKADWAEEHGH